MSGAEALFVVGLLANICGIVDFTGKVLRRIQESSSNLHDVPEAFRDVASTLPLLASTLNKTEEQLRSGRLDEDTCRALQPVLEGCLAKIKELDSILEKCIPKEGSSRLKRALKAVSSMGQDKKIEMISHALHKHIQLLTYHHVSVHQISEIEDIELKMGATTLSTAKKPEAYFIVPVHWADDFTGRNDELEFLSTRLCQPDKHTRVAVVGLGGIGKTRLALQYASQHKQSEISVFWIHAATAARMKQASRDILKRVGICGWDDPSLDSLDILKEWFESEESGRWLIIYDNVDDVDLFYGPETGRLASCFPRSDRGSIMITSRNKQIGVKFAKPKNVSTLAAMTDAESNSFLSARLGENDSEVQERTNLSQALEGNPLALVQAVSFISENESTVARYLELYNSNEANRIALLSEDFEDDTRDSEVKNPVAATWVVNFEYLKEHRRLAADVLCLISMFDTQGIPEDLISPMKGDPAQSVEVEKALGILQAYSMITPRHASSMGQEKLGRLFDLHRLVGLATRNWLKMSSQYTFWTAEAVDTMSTQFHDLIDIDDFELQSRYLPHVIALFSSCSLQLSKDALDFPSSLVGQHLRDLHSQKGVVCSTCTAQLLEDLSIYYLHIGYFEDGLRVSRKASALYGIALGPNHRKTLSALISENLCLRQIDASQAEAILRELITIHAVKFGPNNLQTRYLELMLAGMLYKAKRYVEAEGLLRQMMTAPEPKTRREQDFWESVMQALYSTIIKQGRNEEAKSLNLNMSLLPKSHEALLNLAKNHLLLKQYPEAESILLRLLNEALVHDEIGAAVDIEEIYQELGHLYIDQQSYSKAEDVQLRAYDISKERYGMAHRHTKLAMLHLFTNYRAQGRYDQVETLLIPFYHDTNERLGEGHLEALAFRWCLGFSRLLQGRSYESSRFVLDAAILTMEALGDRDQRSIGAVKWLLKAWGKILEGGEAGLAVTKPEGGQEGSALSLVRQSEDKARDLRAELALNMTKIASNTTKIALNMTKIALNHEVSALCQVPQSTLLSFPAAM